VFVRFVITKIRNLFRYASIFVDKNESFFSFPVFADVLGHKKTAPTFGSRLNKKQTSQAEGKPPFMKGL